MKFLFTDLDLTLLDDEKNIGKRDLIAINRFLDEGNYFAFVTGRPFEDTLPIAERYSLVRPGFFIASFNGGRIDGYKETPDRGGSLDEHREASDQPSSKPGAGWKMLRQERVHTEDVRFIFEKAEEHYVNCQTYTDRYVLSLHDSEALREYTAGKRLRPLVFPFLDDLMNFLEEPPFKLVCIEKDDRAKLEKFREYIDPLIKDRLFTLFSSDRLLEFGPISATKGEALRFLAEYTGTGREDTIAAGDEMNDIPMIEAAGKGYAVANARDEVKAAADYVTESDNCHCAIAEITEMSRCGV